MLRTLDGMLGSSIMATDGEIGKIYNVFFDDRSWAVRYMVVETGSWLGCRKLLISPAALDRPHWAEKNTPVHLTRDRFDIARMQMRIGPSRDSRNSP